MICCLGTTKGSLGHCDHKKEGKSCKKACQQSSCLCLKEQDFAGCAEISWGSLLSNRPWKGHVTAFFLKQREILPWDLRSHQILISSWISEGCSLHKGCCSCGQRGLHSLLGTPLIQVFSDRNLQKIFWYMEKQRAKLSNGNACNSTLTKFQCLIWKENRTTKTELHKYGRKM